MERPATGGCEVNTEQFGFSREGVSRHRIRADQLAVELELLGFDKDDSLPPATAVFDRALWHSSTANRVETELTVLRRCGSCDHWVGPNSAKNGEEVRWCSLHPIRYGAVAEGCICTDFKTRGRDAVLD